jgi:cytidylate kinase
MNKDIRRLIDEQFSRSKALQRATLGSLAPEEFSTDHGSVITISRQLGTDGRLVAERLAGKLGWIVWDRDLVDAIAKDAAVSRRIAESFDEKTMSEVEVLARTIVGDSEMGNFIYRKHLARTLLSIAARGHAVILGRGSNFLLPDALSVRLTATERYRMENLMRSNSLSREEALHRIHESDRERATFVRNVYGKDIEDPMAYDLTIKVDEFGVEGAAEIVLTAVQAKTLPAKQALR